MLRLTKVDELLFPDHSYLTSSDECYFLREYTPRAGYSHSETNGLIHNFKKSMDRRTRSKEWYWKEQAIAQITRELAAALNQAWLSQATLVPIPPSNCRTNPLYDDRMTQVLSGLGRCKGCQCDVRELIVQREDMEAMHLHDDRRDPDAIKANYSIEESLTSPTPRVIGLFDDVLTTGAHYWAAKSLLVERFPAIPIVGIFVARRVPTVSDPTSGFDIISQ